MAAKDNAPSRHRSKYRIRLSILLFVLVLAAGMIASICIYAGVNPLYDDVYYLNYAEELVELVPTFFVNDFSFSFLNLVPISISFLLFGYNEWSAILPGIAEYSLLVFVSFFVAERLYGRYFAAYASAIMATAPFITAYVTRVLPDINIGLAVAVSITLFIINMKKSSATLSMLSGIAAVYTIYVKNEGFIYLLLFVIASVLVYLMPFKDAGAKRRAALRNTAITFTAIALGLGLYLFAFYLVTGNPFFSFIIYNTSTSAVPLLQEAYTLTIPYEQINFANSAGWQLFPLGPLVLLAMLGTIIGIYRHDYIANYVSFFNWGIFLYLIFGTSSLQHYIPIPTVSRFFAIVAMPMTILSAYAVYQVYSTAKKENKKRASIAKVALIIAIIAIFVSYIPTYITLGGYAKGIINNRNVLVAATDYIKNSASSNISIFFNTPLGLEIDSLYFANFSLGYSNRFSLYDIAYENEVAINPSSACNNSITSGNSYILDIGSNSTPFFTEFENNSMSSWLGKVCGAKLIGVFENNNSQTMAVYLYKLYKTQ